MRKKKAFINICFSLILEFITVVSGLIVPRLIIGTFGSDVNGLVNSIASFVAYITLLQTGVGSAVKAALYKPLAQKNHDELCTVVKSAEKFFKKIAIATIIYIGALMVLFPGVIAKEYGWIYTASLVLVVGIGTAAQYFFGITYQMVLEADQVSYIYSIIQIITVILNTVFVVILINFGYSIQIVKLASAFFFVIRPIVLGAYTKRRYKINLNVPDNKNLLSQRWDAFAQSIAYFIHSKTDIFVLTIFSSLINVSIYSVYALVTTGLASLIDAIDKAVRAAFGNIIACNEKKTLRESFSAYNSLIHMLATSFFATAGITVFSFIQVYVKNVQDANYIQPIFGVLIVTAQFVYCLRSPYNSIIYAAGKFKETSIPAGIEAGINIVLSCILVIKFGLVGVAIGTLVAMSYRTITFIAYLRKNILEFSVVSQIKRFVVTFFGYFLMIYIGSKYPYEASGYFSWAVYAAIVFSFVSVGNIMINYLLDRNSTCSAVKLLFFGKRNGR